MIDGYVVNDGSGFNAEDSTLYYSLLDSTHVGFKNTVETDQETSLIQAVYKYITKTGDNSILDEQIGVSTVEERIHQMLEFLNRERYSKEHGLIFGAMTADWGDVQPTPPDAKIINQDLIDINQYSYMAIDIYDNAMLLIAINDMKQLGIATEEEQNFY